VIHSKNKYFLYNYITPVKRMSSDRIELYIFSGEDLPYGGSCIGWYDGQNRVLIDPNITWSPYGYSRGKRNVEQFEEDRARIIDFGVESDFIIVTHSHKDHKNLQNEILNRKLERYGNVRNASGIGSNSYGIKLTKKGYVADIKPRCSRDYNNVAVHNGDSDCELYLTLRNTKHGVFDTYRQYTKKNMHSVGLNYNNGFSYRVVVTGDCIGPMDYELAKWIAKYDPNVLFLDGFFCKEIDRFPNHYKRSLENVEHIVKNSDNLEKLVNLHHGLRTSDTEKVEMYLSDLQRILDPEGVELEIPSTFGRRFGHNMRVERFRV